MGTHTTWVDLIRHGEPVGGKKYRGQTDDPLSEAGWRQMWAAVDGERPWHAVVSSPLSRCADFARALADEQQVALTHDERLMEIGFGAWEGRTADELHAEDADQLPRFYDDPIAHAPPGAEPLPRFAERVVAAWDDLATRHRNRHVLVVCHSGVIRMVVRHILQAPLESMFRLQVPYAGRVRIRVDGDDQAHRASLMIHDPRT